MLSEEEKRRREAKWSRTMGNDERKQAVLLSRIMLRYKYVCSFGSALLLVGLRKQGKRDAAIDYGAKG
jgi:hypothetical protein